METLLHEMNNRMQNQHSWTESKKLSVIKEPVEYENLLTSNISHELEKLMVKCETKQMSYMNEVAVAQMFD